VLTIRQYLKRRNRRMKVIGYGGLAVIAAYVLLFERGTSR
jgi:hypothetical protein